MSRPLLLATSAASYSDSCRTNCVVSVCVWLLSSDLQYSTENPISVGTCGAWTSQA